MLRRIAAGEKGLTLVGGTEFQLLESDLADAIIRAELTLLTRLGHSGSYVRDDAANTEVPLLLFCRDKTPCGDFAIRSVLSAHLRSRYAEGAAEVVCRIEND